jgi:TetR/AcrR family transcriptional regulator, tetracycline repressor protein
VAERAKAPPNKRLRVASVDPPADGGSPSLWFNTPMNDQDRRPQLTRQRIVTEALAVIAQDGAQALTMRSLAARLGVVPGALYHHFGNKQQLQDLVLDGVLAEVDFHTNPSLAWTEQLKILATRLRQVLEAHPGVAGILKTRDPLGPHSLALAEAFLSPLQTAGFADRQAGLAFFLLLDYTIGFAVSSPRTSVNEQRVRDTAIRTKLHAFFRTLPPDRFPALVASASTSGSTTATSGSPPAWRCWLMGWNTHGAPPTGRRSGHDRPLPRRPAEDVNKQQTTDGDT